MEDTASMTLGKRILYHRKRLGLTQEQLADRMGVTAQAVSKWEHDLSCPDVTTLPRLAEFFGITTDELLGVVPPQKTGTAHVGEVVDPDSEGRSRLGWEFRFDRDSRGSIVFALYLVSLGGLYIAAHLLNWDIRFWSLMWPLALAALGLSVCLDRFSAFGVGALAAGIYFLLENLGAIPSIFTWPVILGALLILWGLSVAADQVRQRHRKSHRVEFQAAPDHRQPRRSTGLRDGYLHADVAFCSDQMRVDAALLAGGHVELAFGSLVLDLTGCGDLTPTCRLDLDAAFCSLVLQVPRKYRVELELERTGGSVDVSGTPDPAPTATLWLGGDFSFGNLKIQYV